MSNMHPYFRKELPRRRKESVKNRLVERLNKFSKSPREPPELLQPPSELPIQSDAIDEARIGPSGTSRELDDGSLFLCRLYSGLVPNTLLQCNSIRAGWQYR